MHSVLLLAAAGLAAVFHSTAADSPIEPSDQIILAPPDSARSVLKFTCSLVAVYEGDKASSDSISSPTEQIEHSCRVLPQPDERGISTWSVESPLT